MESTQDQSVDVQRHPTSEEWENSKSILYNLYIEQGLPLTVVQEEMARRGHIASRRMYNARFAEWDFGKNTLKQDWQAFVIFRDRARAAGTDLRQVQIHNRIRSLPELKRYLRKHKISEADLLEEAMKAGVSVPDHVRSVPTPVSQTEQVAAVDGVWKPIGHSCDNCANKALDSLQSTHGVGSVLPHSPLDTAQESSHGGSNAFEDSQLQHYHPHSCSQGGERRLEDYPHHDHSQSRYSGMSAEISMYMAQAVNPTSGIMPPGPSFVDLSEMAGLVDVPSPLRISFHSTRGMGLAHGASNLSGPMFQPLTQSLNDLGQIEGVHNVGESWHLGSVAPLHFPLPMPVPGSIPDPAVLYVQTEDHYALMSDVFMACMSVAAREANQDVDLAEIWMEQATVKLRVMCAAQDPMFLATIHMILVWLQVHDTESRAESLIRKLSAATAFELGKDSPIAITLECMTAAAGKRLPNSRVELGTLRGVVRDFGTQLGPEHPHTLLALYYMCFHMMRVDRKFAEAEEELRKLYDITSKILGKSSFQAVCVLATLSRAQSRQKKHHTALDTINQCLQEAPLGLNHPHRLDLLARKALICGHLKDKLKPEEQTERQYWDAKMERLYWIVVRGRVATLGRYHTRTEAAHETLIEILVENGRYELEAVKGEAHELLTKPQVAVSSYESWWWSMVPKDREGEVQRAPSEGAAG